jgi:hypothetical protein
MHRLLGHLHMPNVDCLLLPLVVRTCLAGCWDDERSQLLCLFVPAAFCDTLLWWMLQPFLNLTPQQLTMLLPLLTDVPLSTLKTIFPLIAQTSRSTILKMVKFLRSVSDAGSVLLSCPDAALQYSTVQYSTAAAIQSAALGFGWRHCSIAPIMVSSLEELHQ